MLDLVLRQSLFYFRFAGKFCLTHRLKQLTRDTKSDINCLRKGYLSIVYAKVTYQLFTQRVLTRRNEKL